MSVVVKEVLFRLILGEGPGDAPVLEGALVIDVLGTRKTIPCAPDEAGELFDRYLKAGASTAQTGEDETVEEDEYAEEHAEEQPRSFSFEGNALTPLEEAPVGKHVPMTPPRNPTPRRTVGTDEQGNPVVPKRGMDAAQFLGGANPNARGLESL